MRFPPASWGLAAFLAAGLGAEARFYRVADPVRQALEQAADGDLEGGLDLLRKATDEAPGDSEAWAALAVLSREAKLTAQARRAEAQVRLALPEQAQAILASQRQRFKARQQARFAEKEVRGELPYAEATPAPTPDPKLWEKVEAERRPTPTPLHLPSAESLKQGPRLHGKKSNSR